MTEITNSTNLKTVLHQFEEVLGETFVISEKTERQKTETATFLTNQKVLGILYPKNQLEIQQCLKIANEHRLKIYPISRGKNWGYGSKVPTDSPNFILSLERLNQVVDFDENSGIARVQAGVSFQQLYEFLENRQANFVLSSPGSTLEASVVGNTLERGIAQTIGEERTKRVIGLEVILPTGELIQTGMRAFSDTKNYHPFGLGADLKGLFFQSNLGIVTEMTFQLPRRPKFWQQYFFEFSSKQLFQNGFSIFQDCIFKKITASNISIYNHLRVSATNELWTKNQMEKADWYATTVIFGESIQQLSAKEQWLKKAFATSKATFSGGGINASSPFLGQPSTDSLKLAYWKKKEKTIYKNNPDLDACGVIWVSPVVRLESESIKKCLSILQEVFEEFNYSLPISVQVLDEKYVYIVTSILFDRSEKGADEKALICHKKLITQLLKNGFPPYRLSHLDQPRVQPQSGNIALIQCLKKALDPNDILAPRRYDFRDFWQKKSV